MASHSNRRDAAPLPTSISTALRIESVPIIMLTKPFVGDWGLMTSIPRTHGKQALQASAVRFNITIC